MRGLTTLCDHDGKRACDRADVAALPVSMGGRNVPLESLFHCDVRRGRDKPDGTKSDETGPDVIVEGSPLLRYLGHGWRGGRMLVLAHGGDFIGASMRSGTIRVNGDCGDFAGAGMENGRLWVDGNCGDCLAAPQAGERAGMRGGTIIVGGRAGMRAGEKMRRGTLFIAGASGDYCAAFMRAGTIIVGSSIGKMAGYGMGRGTIFLLDPGRTKRLLSATFRDCGVHDLPFFTLIAKDIESALGDNARDPMTASRHYARARYPWPSRSPWRRLFHPLFLRCGHRFGGDLAALGKGEIFLPNPD